VGGALVVSFLVAGGRGIMADQETVLTKMYDLLLYAVPQLEKFPRTQKFLLADRIETSMLNILDALIEAYYGPPSQKKEILRRTNIRLEQLRYLVRLSHDFQFFSHQKYGLLSEKINEVGKMVGGWMRSLRENAQAPL
jgi:hypothetical protein